MANFNFTLMYRVATWRSIVRLKSSIRFDEECGEGKRQENNPSDDCYYGNRTRKQHFSHDACKPKLKTGEYEVIPFLAIAIKKRSQTFTCSDRYLLSDHSPSDHSQSCAQTVSQGSTYSYSKRILEMLPMENDSLSSKQTKEKHGDKCRFICSQS